MAQSKGMGHGEMGEVNEYLVLEYMREQRRSTRPQIASDLRLSQASVSRIVSKLLERQMVVETDDSSQSGGRPRRVLEVNQSAAAVIGIDLGGTKCHGVLSDLEGNVLAEKYLALAETRDAYDALTQVWQAMSSQAQSSGLAVSALAIGVPAVIEPETGLAVRGPNVGWEGFNLVERAREFGVPFLVDNDVNLAASAEGEIGRARGVSNYAVLSLGTGLGGAVVANGRLLRGRNNAAGEVATLLPSLAMVREHRVGGLGGMETLLSGPAIEARARALVAADPAALAELGERPSTREVIEKALAGSPAANQVMDPVIDGVAMVVITLVAVVDPEMVVLDGSVGRAMAPFLPRIAQAVGRHVPKPPRLEASDLGPNATVRGAIVAAQHLRRSRGAPQVLSQFQHSKGVQP